MKKLEKGMLVVGFLSRGMFIPGIIVSILLIVTNYILVSVGHFGYWQLLSEIVSGSGMQIAYTAAVVVVMAALAAVIASRWIGSKSMITLSMLPTGRMWIFAGWVFGGAIALLMLVAAMNFSVNIAEVVLRDNTALKASQGIYVYTEPNALWYTYVRVGFLSWVCPDDFNSWTRFALVTVGAPIVTVRATLGFLANRPFSALLSLGCYILSCVLMTSDAGVTNFFTLIVVIIAVIRAYGLLKEGETI